MENRLFTTTTAINGYVKATVSRAIAITDTILTAIGILEKKIDDTVSNLNSTNISFYNLSDKVNSYADYHFYKIDPYDAVSVFPVLGNHQCYASYCVIGGGERNQVIYNYATVSGGKYNVAQGQYSAIGGGYQNFTNGNYTTVGGGNNNQAIGATSSIVGGQNNKTSGSGDFVGGGVGNTTYGFSSSILGGFSNYAGGYAGAVAGGTLNKVNSDYGAIIGGQNNFIGQYAQSSLVAAGEFNTINGSKSSIVGGNNNTINANITGVILNSVSTTLAANNVVAINCNNITIPAAAANSVYIANALYVPQLVTPASIKSAVSGGSFTNGELQGSQPANSKAGMRFSDNNFKYEYDLVAADSDGSTYGWLRCTKA